MLAGWVDVGGAGVPDEWLEVEEDVIEDEVEAEFVVERDVGRRPPTMLPNRPPPVDEGLADGEAEAALGIELAGVVCTAVGVV